mgnify:CR=1 FL=1
MAHSLVSCLFVSFGVTLGALALPSCGDDGGSAGETASGDVTGQGDGADSASTGPGGTVDITDAEFTNRAASCTAYVGTYTASVTDLGRSMDFTAVVEIAATGSTCEVTSNSIPNHDFDDGGAFVTPTAEVTGAYYLAAAPTEAASPTSLSLQYDDAIFLNGVKLDVLAAACYGVGGEPLGQEKIGCMQEGTPWRYDPMYTGNSFGTDGHNAHTQPTGAYHYHGNPNAMFDASGAAASGVIGFAADGFPIYGPFIDDGGTIRKVTSGYTLKPGARVSQAGEGAFPAGDYDGTFVDDYEFTAAGDLDECNGMTRDGTYGYYVTDAYPWVIGCFTGSPDDSFRKGM